MVLAEMIVLNDNTGSAGLLNEWGWSLYIEARGHRVLFDADTSPTVIDRNSRILGINLSELDFAVLSHHHGDHYGGFSAVAARHPGLRVYVPPGDLSWARGLPLDLVVAEEPLEVVPGFWLSGPLEAWSGFYEQALGFEAAGWLVVIVGCSHPGVDRLAQRLHEVTGLPILLVIGGFHEPSHRQLDNLAKIARYICPTHCSGWRAKKYVANNYPDKYCEAKTGTRIAITEDLLIMTKDFPY